MVRQIFDIQRFAEISNSTSDTVITGTATDDLINNDARKVTVYGAYGNDTINIGNNTSINNAGLFIGFGGSSILAYGEAGNDIISLQRGISNHYDYYGSNTLVGGTGNDTIYTNDNGNTIVYNEGDGNDVVVNYEGYDKIIIGSENYSTMINGNDIIIQAGTGSVKLKDTTKLSYVKINDDIITIDSQSRWATVSPENGIRTFFHKEDTVLNGTDNDDEIKIKSLFSDTSTRTIYGNGGNDSIYNKDQNNFTIDGGNGDDIIRNGTNESDSGITFYGLNYAYRYGENILIIGGYGNDSITNYGDSVTINAGDGDDIIYHYYDNYRDILNYNFSNNYSNDLLNDYILNDYILNDYIPATGALVDYGYGKSTGDLFIDGGAGNDSINLDGIADKGYATVNCGAGNDTVYSNACNALIDSGEGQDVFFYSYGSDTVKNYESGEIVIFNATYTGWNNEGNDLLINSSSGSVRINDAKNKLVEVADSDGNVIAHVYKADGYEGTIDGRGFNAFEVIVGSDNFNNQIFADTGGSSLWGGKGNSNDELYGNSGIDEYIYSYGNGQDNIFNAGSEDAVNLNGVSLEQITSADITDNCVNLKFTDGGLLNINGQVETFILSGERYGADYQSKTWYTK